MAPSTCFNTARYVLQRALTTAARARALECLRDDDYTDIQEPEEAFILFLITTYGCKRTQPITFHLGI